MKLMTALLSLAVAGVATGCTPRIELAVPKEPITINMNVKIEHEIHIQTDKGSEALLRAPAVIDAANTSRQVKP